MQGDLFRGYLAVFFLAACPVALLIRGYMMSRDYDSVVENFRSSRLFAPFRKGYIAGEPFGRAYMTYCLSGLVAWGLGYVRKGTVAPEELDSLSPAIRRRAFFASWLNAFCLAGFLLIAAEFSAQQWLLDTFR